MKLAVPQKLIQDTWLYAREARNMFVQEGVKNSLTEFAGGTDLVRAVTTGGFPLGTISPTSRMGALEAGEPVRHIGGGYNASGAGFMVRADSSFRKPEDLKGKKFKIAYSRPNSASHIVAYLGLKAIGVDYEDKNLVEFVATGGASDTWTALKTGIVDVGWGTGPTISNVELKKEGRVLWMIRDFVKDWMDIAVLTSQSFIDSNSKELRA